MASSRFVYILSPWRADDSIDQSINKVYALCCLKDSIDRGETPIAVHLLYPQVLDEESDRGTGISLGFNWIARVDYCVVYTNRGVSEGMNSEIEKAKEMGVIVEYRHLDHFPDKEFE